MTEYDPFENNPNTAAIKRCKILIIEDDIVARETMKRIFAMHKFTHVSEAENGKIGLEKIRAEKPDLVITDLQMPVMDGFALCRAVRADRNAAIANLSILVQTGIERPAGGLQTIYEAGASDYLLKPIDPAELLARSIFHLEFSILADIVKKFKTSPA
jgi:CheY-like chemotaxis protein